MTDHKPLPVSGYTPQTSINVNRVNRNKWAEELVLRIIDDLKNDANVDPRWLAEGKIDIEKGFMAINRAIFNPQRMSREIFDSLNTTPEKPIIGVIDGQKGENNS